MLTSVNVPEFDYSQISSISLPWSTTATVSIVVFVVGVLMWFFGAGLTTKEDGRIPFNLITIGGAVVAAVSLGSACVAVATNNENERALRNSAFAQSLEGNYGAELVAFDRYSTTDETSGIKRRNMTLETDGQIRECVAYIKLQEDVYSVYCQGAPLEPLKVR